MYPKIEHVKLRLFFKSQHQNNPPIVEIFNNQQIILPATTVVDCQEFVLDLDLPNDVTEPGQIKIIRSNFNGVDQQLLTLEKIYIDDINLNKICYQSKYYPTYPEPWISEQRDQGKQWPEYLTGVLNWGWNGHWVLDYETPIYTWLLKNV
jgi:hypothetical protein